MLNVCIWEKHTIKEVALDVHGLVILVKKHLSIVKELKNVNKGNRKEDDQVLESKEDRVINDVKGYPNSVNDERRINHAYDKREQMKT